MDLSLTEESALADIAKITTWLLANKPNTKDITVTQRQFNALLRIAKKASAGGKIHLRDGSSENISIAGNAIKYNGFNLKIKPKPIKEKKETLEIFYET